MSEAGESPPSGLPAPRGRVARAFVAHPRHPLTGRQFAVRGRTERELDAYLHQIESFRQRLKLGLSSPDEVDRALRRLRFGAITLERAALSYARRPDLSRDTRRRVESVIAAPLRPLAGEELDAIDGPRLAKLFDRLAGRLSHRALVTVWRTLRAIVRHAAERGWIARVPWGSWRPRTRAGQEGRPLRDCARTEDERARLVSAARELDLLDAQLLDAQGGGRYRALEAKIAAGAYLGLRHGEIAGLEWRDVRTDPFRVNVCRQWDRPSLKGGGAELEAPELQPILERHRARLEAGRVFRVRLDEPIFEAPTGGHFKEGRCLSTLDLRAVVQRAGLGDCAGWFPHSLRDTFATIEAGRHEGDLARVAARTRHKSLASLVVYLRSFQRGQSAAPALGRGDG